jgi:hypothetical protein
MLKIKFSTLILAVLSFGFGIYCSFLLLSSSTYLEPFIDSCYKNTAIHKFVGVKGKNIDKFLCFITPFFEAALLKSGSLGIASFMLVSQMFLGFTSFGMIESGKKAATGFVYGVFLVFLIGQIIGIAAAIPALYLPSLIINASRSKELKDRMVSPQVVFFAFIANVMMGVAFVGLTIGEHVYFYEFVTLFQFIPLSAVIVLLFVRTFGYPFEAKVGLSGSQLTRTYYLIFSISAAATWYGALYLLWTNGVTMSTILAISKSSPESCALFLIYDGVLLSVSGAIAVFALDGFVGLVKFLLLAIVFGPGGSFLLSARSREATFSKELEALDRKESSKKAK